MQATVSLDRHYDNLRAAHEYPFVNDLLRTACAGQLSIARLRKRIHRAVLFCILCDFKSRESNHLTVRRSSDIICVHLVAQELYIMLIDASAHGGVGAGSGHPMLNALACYCEAEF